MLRAMDNWWTQRGFAWARARARARARGAFPALTGALLALSSTSLPAHADLRALADGCSSLQTEPAQAVRLCSNLLDSGALGETAQAQTLLNRGRALMRAGRIEAAISDINQALRLHTEFPEAWFDRGRALTARGDHAEAHRSYNNAVLLRPDDWLALVGRASSAIELNAAHEALPDLNRVIELQPKQALGYLQRARAYAALGRRHEALSDFSTAAEMAPDDPAPLMGRAALQEESAPRAALADYSAVILQHKDLTLAYYRRGRLFDRMGHPSLAERDLKRAWRMGYRDEWLHNRMIGYGG
ncbi:MAG: tetratricopeptide repeat protein [Neomegalonema sp.]|nr:tetratricopeptide repeat protein [Neomegalonema sp.]